MLSFFLVVHSHGIFLVLIYDAPVGDTIQIRQSGIDPDGVGQNQAAALPVLGNIGKAMLDGILNPVQMDFLTIDEHLTGDI